MTRERERCPVCGQPLQSRGARHRVRRFKEMFGDVLQSVEELIAPETISRTERGYLNQHELHEMLQETFSGDEFLTVKCGVSGADLQHKVFYLSDGKPVCAGIIPPTKTSSAKLWKSRKAYAIS